MHETDTSQPLRIMVASSVYGFQTELEQLCAMLDAYGYTVWNSHLGTIQAHPGKSNLDICLDAVRQCDLFLGIIRPVYGSGIIGPRSITHEEMRLAVSLNKPRWFLVHDHVTFTRQLLRPYMKLKDGKPRKKPFRFQRTKVFDDLRVLDMYDDMTQADVPVDKRTGHWVQEFHKLAEAMTYLQTQFANRERIRQVVEEMRAP